MFGQDGWVIGLVLGADNNNCNMLPLLQWSMNDGPLMLKVNLPVVGVIHQQCSKFISGAQIKEKGDLNLMKVLILSISSLHKDLNCNLVQKHTHSKTCGQYPAILSSY